MANTRNSIQEYRFNISEYELCFSVPKAFLSEMWNRLDRYNPEWEKGLRGEGSYAEYFFHTHLFKGPIWVGNYASMIFIVSECEVDAGYDGQVCSLEEFDKYLEWQLQATGINASLGSSGKKVSISGFDWIQYIIDPPSSDKIEIRGVESTTLLMPLSGRRHLRVLVQIDELVPSKTNRWLADAHKMRDLILDSIALRKVK